MSKKINKNISIGPNLQALRLKNRLTQEQVVLQLQIMGLSISREMLAQMESGRYNIRISVLLALKNIYNASFNDFFADLSLFSE